MWATKVLRSRDLLWVRRKGLGSGRVKWPHGKGGRLSNGVQFSVSREAGKQQATGGTSMEWLKAGMSGVREGKEPRVP